MALNDSNLYSYSVKKGKRAVSTIHKKYTDMFHSSVNIVESCQQKNLYLTSSTVVYQ